MKRHRYRVRNFNSATHKERWVVHPLRKGDTLYHLAELYGTSVLQVLHDNPRFDPRYPTPGQILLLRREKE
ncbi:MAG: LysM peptidoglycan-binding domain-containing protein [Firmicutes bacterium]|nr:LysM peptidoglycan-binding domain-containing protein [Bacillota bacterium]